MGAWEQRIQDARMKWFEDDLDQKLAAARRRGEREYWNKNPIPDVPPSVSQGNHSYAGYVPEKTKRDVLPANPWSETNPGGYMTVDEAAAKDPKYNGLRYAQKNAWDTFNDMMRPMADPNQPYADFLQKMKLKNAIAMPKAQSGIEPTFDQLENKNPWYFRYKSPTIGTHIGSTNQPQWTGGKPLSNPLSFLEEDAAKKVWDAQGDMGRAMMAPFDPERIWNAQGDMTRGAMKFPNVVNSEVPQWSGPTASTPITDSIINRIKMFMMGG